MSASSLPYHLRTNKSIDRQIFFDLLGHLSFVLPNKIHEYKYISMGGPMLEDHYTLHNQLGMTKLTSLERDSAALSRQKFNQPYECISCLKTSTREFINKFEETGPVVIWLDYTDTDWQKQFNECSDLLNNLKPFDIFKVTFNANPDVLRHDDKSPINFFKEKANHKFLNENLIDNDVITMHALAKTIELIFKAICDDALMPDDCKLYPLTQFRYIDNRHQMLTVSGVIIEEENTDLPNDLDAHCKLIDWPYLHNEWGSIESIDVPVLTIKERQEIDQYLPIKIENIDSINLPFKLHKTGGTANKMLEEYIKYYRYIPNYLKVAV